MVGLTIAQAAEPIRQGDEGAEVTAVQEQLLTLGYTVSVDGNFGPTTVGAVKAFQKDRGLDADGIIGEMTHKALLGRELPVSRSITSRYRRVVQEALRYQGVPYSFGGTSPSGFDCSGFVSWVINNCGNGWNIGRCTADGLRSHCSQVSPSEAKPGDLIFFQGTYNTSGASHVGIYVGNNMMIHCGKPVQYTSIASAYWQEHFMAFGRLH